MDTRRTVCPHDCPDTCSIIAKVEDGRVVSTKGDTDHPFTRGALCAKVLRYAERVHAPERLLYPMRRTGPKGSGQFQRITWDEALDTIAKRTSDAIRTHGGESVFAFKGSGTMGLIQAYIHLPFLYKIGASQSRGSLCSPAASKGWKYTIGAQIGSRPESVADTDLLIAWGSNMASTNMHMLAFYEQARKKGARLIVIDPYRNRTANQADLHVPIRPGTDAALALSMMHVLVEEELIDQAYINAQTLGFDRLLDILPEYAPEQVADIVGYSAEGIRELARMYGQARAPFIRIGMGLSRHRSGGMAVRTIACLPGMVGAFQKKGGGALLFTSDAFSLRQAEVTRPDLLQSQTRQLDKVRLGHILLETGNPAIDVLFVTGGNPALSCPDQGMVRKGLSREDLFTVVHEQFLTDTAMYADIVLPATTSFECFDVYNSYGHTFLQKADPVIEPLGESRSNHWFYTSLARKMGFTDEIFTMPIQKLAEKLLPEEISERARTDFWNGDHVDQWEGHALPFNNGFPTPSGKLEFYSEDMASDGFAPLPIFEQDEPVDGLEQGSGNRPDLHLLTPPAHFTLNTSFGAVSSLREKEVRPSLLIHPEDARQRGIHEEGWVEVGNKQGAVQLWAKLSRDMTAGTVAAEGVWWTAHTPDGQPINLLTSAALTDMGYGSTLHDNKVWVRNSLETG